ncbi:MAG: alpha/beta fold hydrolase [Anaerolineales bacterium]|jgi:3-oxoadipate enol-lactonase|nr:alpha/beta fold hydrolase [Anaerolineales bacterium]
MKEHDMPLYYAEFGHRDNPTIVLLHGLGMGHRMWLPQIESMSEHYHILAPDLPGFARSFAYGPFTLMDAAMQVADLIRERCRQAVHVCGLSLGAMVGLQLGLAVPDLVTSLILSGAQVHPPMIVMTLQHLMFTCIPEKQLLKSLATDIPSKDDTLLTAAREDAFLTGKRSILQAMRAAAQANFRPALRRIQTPTLVLCGSKDRVNLPAARELACGIPKAELHIIAEAGHVWNVEMPTQFTDIVCEFVNSVQ